MGNWEEDSKYETEDVEQVEKVSLLHNLYQNSVITTLRYVCV